MNRSKKHNMKRYRMTAPEREVARKQGYIQRGGRILFPAEKPEPQTKAERIDELRKMEFDSAIRINIGPDRKLNNRIQYWARFTHEFHEGIGGIIIIMPTGKKTRECEAEDAARTFDFLASMARDPEFWPSLHTAPHGVSCASYDARQEIAREEKAAPLPPKENDSDPDTWPAARSDPALEAIKAAINAAYGLTFLKSGAEFQDEKIRHVATGKVADDAMTIIRDAVDSLDRGILRPQPAAQTSA